MHQTDSHKRKRTDEETAVTTNVSSTVSKPSNDAVPKLNVPGHTKKNECQNFSVVHIWFDGSGCCRTISRYISLDYNMDETKLMKRVRNKFHLSCEDAEAKIELISRTTQQVEWTISSKREDESCWTNYREGLFMNRNERGTCDGVYAVVTCSDLSSFVCEGKDGSQVPCSRRLGHTVG